MLLLTKLAALGVIIWFYLTADKNGEPPVKWAIIGLIGYGLAWLLIDFVLDNALSAAMAKSKGGSFIIGQFPVLGGLIAAYFIRKKLVGDAKTTK
jgi:hypothetical protein